MQDHRPNPTLNLEYCADRPIFMDFLQQAQRSPDAIAVVSHDATCSYRQLEQISHGIASFLKVNGATESDRVVIVSNRWSGWWPIRCCDDGGWRFRPFVRCLAVARHALEGGAQIKS
jgi:non-ribosomal peptide synthetase component F